MPRPISYGSAISIAALAGMLAACAIPNGKVASAAGPQMDQSKVGLATRALGAFSSGDFTTAISLGEQAVENSPNTTEFRGLLGSSYFASGRFASAEAAYRDALLLNGNQPELVLKLALVQIAQGKRVEALALLDSARSILEPADYGLALALAGRAPEAIAVLEPAARQRGADARVRQNLAFSHALAGDWSSARVIAAQDVPADQLDQRIQQWMQLATPKNASDQVAALTGVTPATSDPGQPVRLALVKANNAVATAQAPAASPQQAQVAEAAPLPAYAAPAPDAAPAPAFAEAPQYVPPAPSAAAEEEEYVYVAPRRAAPKPAAAAPARKAIAQTNRKAPLVRASSYVPKAAPLRAAALSRGTGRSNAVLQLGAYGSPQRVAAAWNVAARRYSALRPYMPVSARFDSPRGIFYRLSVKGFATPAEAKNLCINLRRSGASCFVRTVAGDSPVRIASR